MPVWRRDRDPIARPIEPYSRSRTPQPPPPPTRPGPVVRSADCARGIVREGEGCRLKMEIRAFLLLRLFHFSGGRNRPGSPRRSLSRGWQGCGGPHEGLRGERPRRFRAPVRKSLSGRCPSIRPRSHRPGGASVPGACVFRQWKNRYPARSVTRLPDHPSTGFAKGGGDVESQTGCGSR